MPAIRLSFAGSAQLRGRALGVFSPPPGASGGLRVRFETDADVRQSASVGFIPGATAGQVWLLLITQQFSLRVPDLQAMAVDYVMIWTQCFGGFDRRFERLKRLHGMAVVSRDAERSV